MSFSSDSAARTRPVHEKVIYAVANAKGVEPTDLDPLYETIDPEALDSLFEDNGQGTITFDYEGHNVVVHDDAAVDGVEVELQSYQTIGFEDDSGASAAGQ